ncbi:hypothetical protein L4C38_06865 [Vibrio kasasachensis]|uniref:hypothetical protein n=1 Tax=Vibrio kasasachensis TaxID=2910248 RepID=UPI003D097D37
MTYIEQLGGITSVMVIFGILIFASFMSLTLFNFRIRNQREMREFDMTMRREETDMKLKAQQLEFEQQKANDEADYKRKRMELEFAETLKESTIMDKSSEPLIKESGLFFIPVDEDVKGTFSDMLKGFEDYAKLIGYDVSLSIDSSHENTVGYKFSLRTGDNFWTREDIQKSISDYIKSLMVKSRGFNAPENADPKFADPKSTTMRKLKLLKHQVNETNRQHELNIKLCEILGNAFTANQPQIFITQQQLLENKMKHDNRQYSADGSSNVIQGDYSGNTIENSTIQIGKNVNQKNEQAEALLEAIQALKVEKNPLLDPAIRQFENAHEEMLEEEEPDSSRLERFLTKGSETIKQVGVAADTFNKVNKALELFSAIPL